MRIDFFLNRNVAEIGDRVLKKKVISIFLYKKYRKWPALTKIQAVAKF